MVVASAGAAAGSGTLNSIRWRLPPFRASGAAAAAACTAGAAACTGAAATGAAAAFTGAGAAATAAAGAAAAASAPRIRSISSAFLPVTGRPSLWQSSFSSCAEQRVARSVVSTWDLAARERRADDVNRPPATHSPLLSWPPVRRGSTSLLVLWTVTVLWRSMMRSLALLVAGACVVICVSWCSGWTFWYGSCAARWTSMAGAPPLSLGSCFWATPQDRVPGPRKAQKQRHSYTLMNAGQYMQLSVIAWHYIDVHSIESAVKRLRNKFSRPARCSSNPLSSCCPPAQTAAPRARRAARTPRRTPRPPRDRAARRGRPSAARGPRQSLRWESCCGRRPPAARRPARTTRTEGGAWGLAVGEGRAMSDGWRTEWCKAPSSKPKSIATHTQKQTPPTPT
jgi:hypothetical protein